jgi:hypothetical protein
MLHTLDIGHPEAQRRALGEAPQRWQINHNGADGMPHEPIAHLLAVVGVGLFLGLGGSGLPFVDHTLDRTADERPEEELQSSSH